MLPYQRTFFGIFSMGWPSVPIHGASYLPYPASPQLLPSGGVSLWNHCVHHLSHWMVPREMGFILFTAVSQWLGQRLLPTKSPPSIFLHQGRGGVNSRSCARKLGLQITSMNFLKRHRLKLHNYNYCNCVITQLHFHGSTTIHNGRRWKQPKCPWMDEWINKAGHTHTVEYYSAVKRNETLGIPWQSSG